MLMNAGIFIYHFCTKNITYPIAPAETSSFFLFKYQFWTIIASIFTINIYVVSTSYIILRTFEKTQATEVLFIFVFLASLLLDTSRLYIPLYGLDGSYSYSLIHLGNITLTSRLMAPISLFALSTFCGDRFRQQTEQNCLIVIVISIFFALFLPLNTAIIKPNLCVSYGFTRVINVFTTIFCTISVITLYISNKQNDFSQINTLGFIMIHIGYNILFDCYNLFGYIIGTLILSVGTWVYLTKLHQHYLWID
ncbi:MAG: hypothetical protein K5681_01550 [Treponema sp.]|nr:hypothetical protein [Treponema sp.]